MSFIEVFAGCGGMSTGLIKAGWKSLLLVDNDKSCIDTLKKNHAKCNIVQKDVRELDLKEYLGKCDLLVGGVPCQAFSQAGKRQGLMDPRGSLFVDFSRLIEECSPTLFMVENVHGLMTLNKGRIFATILDMLNVDDQYNISHRMMNAVDYQVPQKRKRIIIVGVKKTLQEGEIPNFEFPPKNDKIMVLRDVLTDCPSSPGMQYSLNKKIIMEKIPEGGCWIDLPEDLQKEYLGKSYESGGGKRGIARRLSMDEPCLTLTTSPCQKQTERCHPLETRPFTVREYARIQTFPDDYIFTGSLASQYKQIGNAVPVMLSYHLAMSLMQFLEAYA